ncbi:thioredoxin domain-containing protein [Polymorphospora sp. NPDC051019]|uniref:DsbA family protein n=1 Tax=Polymorphospora sp. NPDC051019 TaxID=3155725 RepID=UPI003443D146
MSNKTSRRPKPSEGTARPAGGPKRSGSANARNATAAARSRKAGGKAAKAIRNQGMSTNMKVTLALLGVVLVGLGALFVVVQRGSDDARAAAAERVVRDDSHRLSVAADGRVTVVEFLDFECPSCAAVYPAVEQLRAEYDGRIDYVVRNYPLPMHANAMNAALAVEAAARQDAFEGMYQKLFETQRTWGNQSQDQAATFEGYARELGLDVDRYRADVADPATAARVDTDREDGSAAGVTGTPTFFVNGERFDGQPTYAGLKAAVDAALAE